MKSMILRCTACALLALVLRPVDAYVLWDSKWPQAQATFHVDIPGAGGLWDTAFENAMAEWSSSGFSYLIVRDTYSNPCSISDDRNGVSFSYDNCGSAFGAMTLAITHSLSIGDETVETDIVFNSNESWNVYAGPIDYFSQIYDFRRVAVHELGHALGLDHEDDIPAIMSSHTGDVEVPQADDIAGVQALYGLGDRHGDSIATATTIAPSSNTSGSINSGGDVDFFRIRLTSRGRLALRTNGTTDTVGTLYSSTGTLIASNDDGCRNGANFCLTRILDAGTYYVKVDGYGTTATGSYTLVSRFTVDDYGNTRAEAKSIAPVSNTSGVINSGTDVDFFIIRLTSRGRLALRTNGTTDTVGSLYSSNGSLIASNDDGCSNGTNFCLGRMLDAGTYYVKVDGYGTTATGSYTLVSRFAEDDYGNTRGEAQVIAPVSNTDGVINSGKDVDYFKIQLTASGRLVLRTNGSTNTVGTLYNAAGTILATNDDGCSSAQNFCIGRSLAAGTYYLKVDGYGTTSTGPYSLVSSLR